jgi:hypothetical protein
MVFIFTARRTLAFFLCLLNAFYLGKNYEFSKHILVFIDSIDCDNFRNLSTNENYSRNI